MIHTIATKTIATATTPVTAPALKILPIAVQLVVNIKSKPEMIVSFFIILIDLWKIRFVLMLLYILSPAFEYYFAIIKAHSFSFVFR